MRIAAEAQARGLERVAWVQAKLGRTREAYVGAIDRILLAQEFLASASQSQIVAVLEEALGHAIDTRIYTVDIVRQKHIEIFS